MPGVGPCTTALMRKVEVSNPHGSAVSLFSRQGAPSQRGIPSGAEGQRIERWRGCPRPSLSKRAPFLSVNPPRLGSGPCSVAGSAPGSIRTSTLRCRRPLRVQSRHGGMGPISVQSHHPEPTRGPQPYQGCALPTELLLHGGAGWSLTSVARVATGYLNPRSRRQGCGGRSRTPDDGG